MIISFIQSRHDTIIKIKRSIGEDILYFKADSGKDISITISRPGYESLPIHLSAYGISLSKGKAWKFQVGSVLPEQKLNVRIETRPTASKILLGELAFRLEKKYTTTKGLHELIIFKRWVRY